MRIFARKYKWYKDLFFQCNVLFDKSIQNSMFDSSRNALSYFVPNRFCAKYVAIKEQEGKEEKKKAFCQIIINRKSSCQYFNILTRELKFSISTHNYP